MNDLRLALESYSSRYSEEMIYRSLMLKLLEIEGGNAFHRECLVGQFTASCWLLNSKQDRFLLMHHSKLAQWFQPGGHCDGDSNALQVAIKEAQEETGILEIVPISEDIFDLDVHFIPKRKGDHTHLHFDVRFLLKALHDDIRPNHESKDMGWFKVLNEEMNPDQALKRMYHKWKGKE